MSDAGNGGTAGVNLDFAEALKATDTLSEVVSGMRETLSRIDEDAQSAKSYWIGQGNNAFAKTAADWEEEGQRLNKLLDEIDAKLRAGYKNYDAEDADIESAFTQLGGSLNL